MNAVLWIVVTLVTEWSLKTIWRECIEPPLVRRSHAKAAEDRAEEAEFRTWLSHTWSRFTEDSETTLERTLREIRERQAAIEDRAL